MNVAVPNKRSTTIEWKSQGLPNVHFLTLLAITKQRYLYLKSFQLSQNGCLFVHSIVRSFVRTVTAYFIRHTTSIFIVRKLHIIQLSNAINAQRIFLGVEAFEYNIVIYQYNAIKGRSSSMSELHILSPVCLRSIFCYLFFTCSHFCLLPVVLNLCMSAILSVSLCHQILDIALFVLHFDLLHDGYHSLRKYVNFHLISVQVLENARYSCSPQTLRDTHNHTHTHAYPLYINPVHLLTDGYSLRYSFNAQI